MKTRVNLKMIASFLFVLAFVVTADSSGFGGGSALAKPEFWTSPEAASLGFPFSQTARVGDTLYLSGVIGTKPGKAEVVEGGIDGQTKAAMEQIQAILKSHDADLTNLAKCTIFLADMSEWPAFNAVYRTYFEAGKFPARSAFGAGSLALNARLEIECIADLAD